MEKTVCLTTAQALLKFLNQQYISIDGKETPYVEGIFHVYGHGNVLGIGQALELEPGHLKSYSGKMSREWPMRLLPLPDRIYARKFLPYQHLLDRARPIC